MKFICLGMIGLLAFGTMTAGAAEQPTTRTEPALAPATVKRVDDSLKMLADGSDDDKVLAEDRLLNTPRVALPLIEAGLKRPGFDAASRQCLVRVVNQLRELDTAEAAESARRQADSDWNVRTALEAYDRVGRHDPKWDEPARQGIREFCSGIHTDPAAGLEVLQHVARDLKCDDPLVLYYEARLLELAVLREADPGKKKELSADALHFYEGACDGFEKLDYPADRKCLAFARLATVLVSTAPKDDAKSRDRAKTLADEAARLLPAAIKLPGITPDHLGNVCEWLVFVQMRFGADRGAVLGQMLPDLLKAAPDQPGPLIIVGTQCVNWAWDARGKGDANALTPEDRKNMIERLAVAEEVLTRAYELDPTDGAAAAEMLEVELVQGKGRDVMEKWFKRAIAADPENQTAYLAKLRYLEPQWHGSPKDMLDFGHQCLATRNWIGGTTYVLLQAHVALSKSAGDEAAYWHSAAVWPDVQAVVGGAAELFPEDAAVQSRYAFWAWRCGQWATANALFKLLGDKASVSVFGGQSKLDEARTESITNAARP